jgi:hypothetical protein
MEETQTIKKKKLIVLMTIARRQNLLEKEILSLYSAEGEGNPSIINYQKCVNPVYRALYDQAIELKQTLSIY